MATEKTHFGFCGDFLGIHDNEVVKCAKSKLMRSSNVNIASIDIGEVLRQHQHSRPTSTTTTTTTTAYIITRGQPATTTMCDELSFPMLPAMFTMISSPPPPPLPCVSTTTTTSWSENIRSESFGLLRRRRRCWRNLTEVAKARRAQQFRKTTNRTLAAALTDESG